ncbi:hypothetical protein GGX14DRAFT_428253 [Mycena pura]|uniref:F-box domain-containing protein n=1 Tax=Mycena pura TaxID=153505 RepID=A0AAD6YID7_9AGAR|nr:hypothetical protein GGX14DRAFT_428253 [Mycena pura]
MRRLIDGVHSQSDEILARVFHDHAEWATEDIIHPGDGPWVVSRVCRSWRKIALAHPEVWSVIRMVGPDPDEMDDMYLGDSDSDSEDGFNFGGAAFSKPDPLFLLNLALERSRDYPLIVTLDFGDSLAESDDENGPAAQMRRMGLRDSSTTTLHSKLIRAVVAHSNRWKTAELQITDALIPHFAPIRNRLSMLTTLTVGVMPARPFPYARNAPNLTDITLYDYPHEKIALPWGSIRRFSETRLPLMRRGPPTNSTATYLKLLRDNPRLDSFEVAYPLPSPAFSQFTAVTHHSLRCLYASEKSLIRALTLPHLEELKIEARKPEAIPAIRDLLTRSKCSLQRLRLIDTALDNDLLAILSSSTSLKKLCVLLSGWNAANEQTMKLLVTKLAEPSFLPCLQDLEIIIAQDYSMDSSKPLKSPCKIGFINDAFVQMLAARWEKSGSAGGPAYLQRVFVLVELPSTVDLSRTRGIVGLQKMCDEGLDIFLRARDPHALDLEQDAKDISYVYDV